MNNNIEKLELALEENNFVGFLRGIPRYALIKSEFVASDIPTDINAVWKTCYIYKNSLKEIMEKSITTLIDGDAYDLYIASAYIFNYFLMKNRDFVTFFIDEDNILNKLQSKLREKKNELEIGFLFPNDEYKIDIWEDIQRWRNILVERCGISLF